LDRKHDDLDVLFVDGRTPTSKLAPLQLSSLLYLLERENQDVSFAELAVKVWGRREDAAENAFESIRTTVQSLRRIVGKRWISHESKFVFQFCSHIEASNRAANFQAPSLDKHANYSYVLNNGAAVASLWVPPLRRSLSPSETDAFLPLLLATTAITELAGRDEVFQELVEWCNDDSLGSISALCLTGRGGIGKTRLALELVHHLRDLETWDARFVSIENDTPFNLWTETEGSPNLLLVFDYASDRARIIAASLRLAMSSSSPERILRVILLARTAKLNDGWLLAFQATTTLAYGAAPIDRFHPRTPIIELKPLAGEDRIRVFEQAYRSIASKLNVEPSEIEDNKRRHLGERFNDPLMLIFAAVIALKSGLPAASSLVAAELSHSIAQLFIEQRLVAAFPENPELALHLVACAGLSSGTATINLSTLHDEARIHNLGTIADPAGFVQRLAAWLPESHDSAANILGPDLVAEAFVIKQLGKRGAAVRKTLLRLVGDSGNNVIPFLVRAVQDYCMAESGARQEPLQWLEIIVKRRAPKNIASLRQILDSLPPLSVSLRPLTYLLINEITTLSTKNFPSHRKSGWTMDWEWAYETVQMLLAFAVATHQMGGKHLASEQAKTAARYAFIVGACGSCEEKHKHLGARCLQIQAQAGELQLDMGEAESALKNLRYPVDNYRQLVDYSDGTSIAAFARMLRALGETEHALDYGDKGLKHANEAQKIAATLSVDFPNTFDHIEAATLFTLGMIESDTGLHEAALDKMVEAVKKYRMLAEENRDAFLPFLAKALRYCGIGHSKAGLLDDARTQVAEAIKLYRELANRNDDVFGADVVQCLFAGIMIEHRRGDKNAELSLINEMVGVSQKRHTPLLVFALIHRLRAECVMDNRAALATIRELSNYDFKSDAINREGYHGLYGVCCMLVCAALLHEGAEYDARDAALHGIRAMYPTIRKTASADDLETLRELVEGFRECNSNEKVRMIQEDPLVGKAARFLNKYEMKQKSATANRTPGE